MTLQGKLGYQLSVVLLTRNRAAGTDLSTAWRGTQNSKNDSTKLATTMCRGNSFQSIQKGHVFQNSGSHIHALGHLIRPTDGKLGHFRTGRLGQMHEHTTIRNSTTRNGEASSCFFSSSKRGKMSSSRHERSWKNHYDCRGEEGMVRQKPLWNS